jgi:uncharacterized protein (DUF1015 family)
MANCFHAADILLPQKISMKKWACVACDQFSSQPEYWDRVSQFVGDAPSTLHMIIPEAYLRQGRTEGRLEYIHGKMQQYLEENRFHTYRRSFIYLERTMLDGSRRRGLIGQIDLEDYDFTPGSGAMIRATEGTVQERIPPRMKLLSGAKLEFPHTILLCDDKKDAILRAAQSVLGEKLYDFDLMEEGGHITGHLISGLGVGVMNAAISEYIAAVAAQQGDHPMVFAVGDGNHSLASAKACWEALKPTLSGDALFEHPARYALAELENIHDPAITFAPIHRVVAGAEVDTLLGMLRNMSVPGGHPITAITASGEETLYLPKESPLAVAVLQPVLDSFTQRTGASIDYIHGEDVVRTLAQQPNTLGILVPGMDKAALFPGVLQGGVLPRKTFSMGQAQEKRYYLEGKMRV